MFQILIDHTDISALTTLYVGLYAGIVLKFLLAWNMEYSFFGHVSEAENTKIIHPWFFWKKNSQLNKNLILIRVVKYIRRKRSSQDDSEGPHFILLPFFY